MSLQDIKKTTYFVVAGGTGGHIIPARVLAAKMAQDGKKVVFVGDKKVSFYIDEEDNFDSKIINCSQIRRNISSFIKSGIKIFVGILQSLFLLLYFRPKKIIAFGGYATFPMLVASVICRKNIILHEQNSHLGKVNRIFSKYAKKIALTFPSTSGIQDDYIEKTSFTGNPVRPEIVALNKLEYSVPKYEQDEVRKDNKMGYDVLLASDFYMPAKEQNLFNILIIGGSGGAEIFSEIFPKVFYNLGDEFKEFIQITQQCRKELVAKTFDEYRSYNLNIVVDSFFNNMDELIRDAHLIIARSGSSSIFEFCMAKKPMILIPFANSADNHQEKNAKYLQDRGAAIVISESELKINKTTKLLKNLIGNKKDLKQISNNAAAVANLNATNNLAKIIYD